MAATRTRPIRAIGLPNRSLPPGISRVPAPNSDYHGSHVAGTIGAATNNSLGVAGINWVSKILPLRVLGKCGGYTSDIADAIRWAAGLSVPGVPANPNPAWVLNLSLGGYAAIRTGRTAAAATLRKAR
jgi:subtilisin family serine protease